jgi:hypothetical protein
VRLIVVALIASGAGLLAGTVMAPPVIAVANHLAADGPYFPTPLVAFGLVALPIGVLLLLIQGGLVADEAAAGRTPGQRLWALGVAGGLVAGLVWYLVLAPSRTHAWMLWTLGGLGVCQGLVVVGCRWLAARAGRCFRTRARTTIHASPARSSRWPPRWSPSCGDLERWPVPSVRRRYRQASDGGTLAKGTPS